MTHHSSCSYISIVAALIYIPTNSVLGFSFFHILPSDCYSWSFWWYLFWQVCGDNSLWLWFACPWWLLTLNIFPLASWPSICFLCKFSPSAHFVVELFVVVVVLVLSCMNLSYILTISLLFITLFENIFSDSIFGLFVLSAISFIVQRLLILIRSDLFIFAFVSS